MKKLFTCALVIGALTTMAGPRNPFKIKLLNEQLMKQHNIVPSKASKNKSAAIVKPVEGTYYNMWNDQDQTWKDSVRLERSYYYTGLLKRETFFDFVTGDTIQTRDLAYDAKGYQDYQKYTIYDVNQPSAVYFFGTQKSYDGQNRLTRFVETAIFDGDTINFTDYVVTYPGDSCKIIGYSPSSEAPGKAAMNFIFYKKNAATTYNTADINYWDAQLGVYSTDKYSNVQWNGPFTAERIFGVDEYDLPFVYADLETSADGLPLTCRYKGVFNGNTGSQQLDIKQALIYVPEFIQTITKNAKGDVVRDEYKYGYNSISQKFDTTEAEVITFVYNVDALERELHQYETPSETSNEELFVFTKNEDVSHSGIAIVSGSEFRTWPNPAAEAVNFNTGAEVQSIAISDLSGKTFEVKLSQNGTQYSVNTGILANGSYILTATSNGKVYRQLVQVAK